VTDQHAGVKAEIICVGTELLMGETADTNSGWLATKLPEIGLELQWISIVGDDLTRLTDMLDRAWRRSDYVFTVGGLGPTLDDLTRDAIAKMLGEPIGVDPTLEKWLRDQFSRRNLPGGMPAQNIRQAWKIPSAQGILNSMGTAPSWWIERDGKVLATLPGPPNEMMNMWNTEIAPRLKQRIAASVILARTFKTIGLGEAAVDEMVRDVYDMPGIVLGCYAKPDGIYLRAIAKAPDESAALRALLAAEERIRAALGPHLWGTDEETPQQRIGPLLKERGYRLAVLESCTGGMVAGAITEVPGASDYFIGGAVTYTNESKVAAGVDVDIIRAHGAISRETAAAMAKAACNTFGADCGIGVTGVAGPSGQEGKPAGTVFIGVAHPGGITVSEHRFPGRRPLVRARSVAMSLLELGYALKKAGSTQPAG